MNELNEELRLQIEKEADEYAGSGYVKNHQPVKWDARFNAYQSGATAYAIKYQAEKEKVETAKKIIFGAMETLGAIPNEQLRKEIDEFLNGK